MRFKKISLLTILMFAIISPALPYAETSSRPSGGTEISSGKIANNISEVEVVDFLTNLSIGYTKGNVEGFLSFYSPKVVRNGFSNIESIKADYLKELNNNSAIVFEIAITEIKNLGYYAVVNGTYNKMSVSKSDNKTLNTSGDIRIKIRKEKDFKIEKIDYDSFITSEYIVGPEDVIEISVWKAPDLSITTVVRPDGVITLPLIGEITASGLTSKELEELIEQKLEEYKQSPIVSVIVKEINSKAVFITGEIIRPGKYPMRSDITIMQAITLAGGFTQWAKKDRIVVIRKSPVNPEGDRLTISYSDIVSGKNMKANILLKNSDTVVVP